LEWYKLHRQHELELNKATLAYELELAKLFVLLNGGAAGAFLTLMGAVWKEGPRPSFAWATCAIASWLTGLFMAAVATQRAYRAQREYTVAYRYRRHVEELRRIGRWCERSLIASKHLGIPSLKELNDKRDHEVAGKKIGAECRDFVDRVISGGRQFVNGLISGFCTGKQRDAPANTPQDPAKAASDEPTPEDLAQAASDARTKAGNWAKSVSFFQFMAVLLFVAGGLLALAAFYQSLTSPLPLAPKAAS
jgi:hypothetical protein